MSQRGVTIPDWSPGPNLHRTSPPSSWINKRVTGSLARQEDQTIELSASSVRQSSTFSGPLPPPEALTQYESVLPGAAERIFQMAERELRHRQSIEGTIVNGDSRRAYLGIVLGTLVALGALGAAAYAISQGEALVGGERLSWRILVGIVGDVYLRNANAADVPLPLNRKRLRRGT